MLFSFLLVLHLDRFLPCTLSLGRDRGSSGGRLSRERNGENEKIRQEEERDRESKTDSQDEYLSAGADGIIPKPVHQKSVLEQIKEARKRIAGKTVPKVIQPSY
jgi:hypothetical protein